MANNEFEIEIKANADKAIAELGDLTKSLKTLENETKKQTASNKQIERSFRGVESSASKFTNTLKGVATAYLSIQGASSFVREAAALEEGFIGVAKTTGMAGKEFAKFKDELLTLSTQIAGVSTEELQQIAESAGQLGIQGSKNILTFTNTVAKLAVATDLTAEEAATSFAKLANVLNEPITNLEKMGSVVNELSNTTTATAGDIVEVANRFAGMGKTFGLASDEIFGYAAALKDVGLTSEVAGSSMTMMLGQMLKESEKFAKFSGKSLQDWSNLVKNEPVKAINLFLETLGKMDSQAQVKALKDLGLGSVQATSAVLKLSGAMKTVNKDLSTAKTEWGTATSLQKEYESASQSLNAQIQQTGNTLKMLVVKIGDELLPVLKDANDAFRNWVQGLDPTKIQQFGKFIGDLISIFATVGGAIGDFVSNLAGIVAEYPKLSFALIGLYKSLGLLQAILPTVTGSFGNIGTAGGKLTQAMPLLTGAIGKVMNSIKLLMVALGPTGAVVAGAFAAAAAGVELYTQSLQKDIEANNAATDAMNQSSDGLQKLGQLYSIASDEVKRYGGVTTETQTAIKTTLEEQIKALEAQAQAMQQNGIETESQRLAYESLSGTIGTLKAKLDTLATTYPISVTADTAQAEQKIDSTKAKADNTHGTMSVSANTTQAEQKTGDTKSKIDSTKTAIQVSAEDKEAQAKLTKLIADAKALKVNLSIQANTAPASAALGEFTRYIEASNPALPVRLETSQADTQLLELLSKIDHSTAVIRIDADVSRAVAKINHLKQPTSSTHTVYVRTVQTRASGGYVQKLATGGLFTGSGRVPGYDPTDSDKVNARLTGGEYVINRTAVDTYGLRALDAINSLKVPKFSTGGNTSNTSTATTTYRPVNINIAGNSFEAQMEDTVVKALTKTLSKRGFR